MNQAHAVLALVAKSLATGQSIDGLDDFSAAWDAGLLSPMKPVPTMSVAEAVATFGMRRTTAALAGIVTLGMDSLLSNLAALDGTIVLALHHFKASDRYFTIVVRPSRSLGEAIVGCIRVNRT